MGSSPEERSLPSERPAQVAGDLRTLVIRHAARGRRIALLGRDPELVRGLEEAGCAVLVDPESPEAIARFRPTGIILFDGAVQTEDPPGLLRVLTETAAEAELIVSFAHAGSAAALVAQLLGQPARAAVSDREARGWFAACGLEVHHRDVVVDAPRPTGLAPDTEVALRALFEQLNPDAAADRFVYVLGRGAPRPVEPRVAGLLSVVIAHRGAEFPLLNDCLAALAAQEYTPVELIVATASADPELAARLERHAPPGGERPQLCVLPSARDIPALLNGGLERARGQYIAFLEERDRVSPRHYRARIEALQAGAEAWALGPVRRTGAPEEERPSFELGEWIRRGWTERCGYTIDRDRLGSFPLTFAEGVAAEEALFFARLGALFAPRWLDGPALCERLGPHESPEQTERTLADLLSAMRARPIRVLGSLAERLQPLAPPHRLADDLEAELERRAPRVHAALKGLARTLRHGRG